MDFDQIIDSNDIGGDDGRVGKEMDEFFERAPAILKNYSGLEYQMHPKAWIVVMLDWDFNSKYLEGGDVEMILVQMRHQGS